MFWQLLWSSVGDNFLQWTSLEQLPLSACCKHGKNLWSIWVAKPDNAKYQIWGLEAFSMLCHLHFNSLQFIPIFEIGTGNSELACTVLWNTATLNAYNVTTRISVVSPCERMTWFHFKYGCIVITWLVELRVCGFSWTANCEITMHGRCFGNKQSDSVFVWHDRLFYFF